MNAYTYDTCVYMHSLYSLYSQYPLQITTAVLMSLLLHMLLFLVRSRTVMMIEIGTCSLGHGDSHAWRQRVKETEDVIFWVLLLQFRGEGEEAEDAVTPKLRP